MSRGKWEPKLPKEYTYMPSNWVGDFDFRETYGTNFDDTDDYRHIYMPVVLKPKFVYENLRTCVLKNRAKMTR